MKNDLLYRVLLTALPGRRGPFATSGELPGQEALLRILREAKAEGATVALFDEKGVTGTAYFGLARREPKTPAARDTYYRAASISKMITALGAMRLHEEGVLPLDEPVNPLLPGLFPWEITPRALLSHTAGIRDGESYLAAIEHGQPLREAMKGDSFGEKGVFSYSNLGFGLLGCAMEKAAGKPFDDLMRELVFDPLHVKASYYPQRIEGTLADARRILPPARKPNFDAAARQNRPDPGHDIDIERDYLLAHGALCVTAEGLSRLALSLYDDRLLSPASRDLMIRPAAAFGERDQNLSQGLGVFIYNDPSVVKGALYGHQGLAYGAVHCVFMNIEMGRGLVSLTSGVSELRGGVIAQINKQLLRWARAEGKL